MLGNNIPVLFYHDISPVGPHTPEWFERQLDVVEELGFTVISSRHAVDICRRKLPLDGRYLVLTFDDGHVSNWLYAAPALARRNMTGTFFALSDFTGQGDVRSPEDGITCLSMADSLRQAHATGDTSQFMNVAELTSLIQDMGMEVFSHTARHQPCFRGLVPAPADAREYWGYPAVYGNERPGMPQFQWDSAYAYNGFWPRWDDRGRLDFVRRSDEERYRFLLDELGRSIAFMRELNGLEEQFLCWPWGRYDEMCLQAMKEAGYVAAFSTERRPVGPGADITRIGRLGVGKRRDARWLRARLKMYSSRLGARVFFKYFRKKHDVGHVVLTSHSDDGSGGGRQLVNSALGLVERGVRVTAVVPEGSVIAGDLQGSAVRVVPHGKFSSKLATARFLWKLCRKDRVDVLHTFHSKTVKPGLVVAALARLAGRGPRVFINRGVLFAPNPLYFLFARIASGIICNSGPCAEVLRRRGVSRKRLFVAPNSLDPAAFAGETLTSLRRSAEESQQPFRILYVGNGKPAKGFDVFVKAVGAFLGDADAVPAECTALGVTSPDKAVPASAKALLEHISCPGKVSHGQVLETMAASHVLVLSSRQESMPNVVLEAMAMALPVICSRAGGVEELVEHGTSGYLCPVESVQCLADRLIEMAHTPMRRQMMGAAGQERIYEHHSLGAKALRLLQIYGGIRGTDPFYTL